jgi:hypothetical protein
MPTGICAFPYPMGGQDEHDLEAKALDEQLVATRLVVPQPEPEGALFVGWLRLCEVFCVLILSPTGAVRAAAAACTDLLHVQCNSLKNKVPAVTAGLPMGSSVELGLSDDAKESFEHLLGQGFRQSAAVKWATTEFTKRALAIVLHGTNEGDKNATETAIMGSFADPKFGRGNTGIR